MGILDKIVGPDNVPQSQPTPTPESKPAQGKNSPEPLSLDDHKKDLDAFKEKHNKEVLDQEKPLKFDNSGLAKGRLFEDNVLKSYAKRTGTPYWEVKKNKKAVLSKMLGEGGYGKKYYHRNKIEQQIVHIKKNIKNMNSWEVKAAKKRLHVLRNASGIDRKVA
ncbi:MAG: hypothetical protein HQ539_02890 [Parcubacteria group bacterium]|nr:hypothetical protein [Parcubacteria group bacterium]